jgi:hypothetical protein
MREELRPHLRDERPPDETVVVVRGRPATPSKLVEHAQRTHDVYVLDGAPIWGVSVFCALDDIGSASLDGLLDHFASYRLVHLPLVQTLRAAGFDLLPTFGRPHYTVRLDGIEREVIDRLVGALGTPEANPYHWAKRPKGR